MAPQAGSEVVVVVVADAGRKVEVGRLDVGRRPTDWLHCHRPKLRPGAFVAVVGWPAAAIGPVGRGIAAEIVAVAGAVVVVVVAAELAPGREFATVPAATAGLLAAPEPVGSTAAELVLSAKVSLGRIGSVYLLPLIGRSELALGSGVRPHLVDVEPQFGVQTVAAARAAGAASSRPIAGRQPMVTPRRWCI